MILSNKRILVIGGAGFIGSHTVDLLLKKDVKEVIVFDNFSRGSIKNLEKSINDKRLKILENVDIRNQNNLDKYTKKIDVVLIFSALWLLHCHEYPREAFETNIYGTFNILESCVKNKVKKIIFSSSASVYGDALYQPMDEVHPLNQKNFYGATKVCGEAMLRSYYYRYKLNYISLRYMNVYGPRQDTKGAYVSVIVNVLKNIFRNKKPIIFGSGKESFDFINVKDCAAANILAIQKNQNNICLNIGSGQKTSLNNLVKLILKICKSDIEINYKKQNNKTLVKNRIGSTDLARKKIMFKAKINLKDGLTDFINWFKKDYF